MPETEEDRVERAMAWAEYRNTYGINAGDLTAAHKAFLAGWDAHRDGLATEHQTGPLR